MGSGRAAVSGVMHGSGEVAHSAALRRARADGRTISAIDDVVERRRVLLNSSSAGSVDQSLLSVTSGEIILLRAIKGLLSGGYDSFSYIGSHRLEFTKDLVMTPVSTLERIGGVSSAYMYRFSGGRFGLKRNHEILRGEERFFGRDLVDVLTHPERVGYIVGQSIPYMILGKTFTIGMSARSIPAANMALSKIERSAQQMNEYAKGKMQGAAQTVKKSAQAVNRKMYDGMTSAAESTLNTARRVNEIGQRMQKRWSERFFKGEKTPAAKDARGASGRSARSIPLDGKGITLCRARGDSATMLTGTKLITSDAVQGMREKGRTINVAIRGSEDYRYLESMGAEASVNTGLPNNILIKEDANMSALLEEFLHGTQNRIGVIERLGRQGAEVHVKEFMIRHARMLGLDNPADIALLKQLQLEELNRLQLLNQRGLK